MQKITTRRQTWGIFVFGPGISFLAKDGYRNSNSDELVFMRSSEGKGEIKTKHALACTEWLSRHDSFAS